MTIPHITSQLIRKHVTYRDVIGALKQALLTDVEPAEDFAREVLNLHDEKQLLFMPSESSRWVGAKLISVNPNNTAKKLDRVQGVYLLMDAETTTPQVIVDGFELTSIRAGAVSGIIADLLLPHDPKHLMLYGYGAQARSHVLALNELRPSLSNVVVDGRDAHKAEMFAANASEHGWFARTATAVSSSSAIPNADVIVCATGAGDPLFDSDLVTGNPLIIAVGSHNPHQRELEGKLLGRSNVIVEDVETALREAGDVILAIEEGHLTREQLIPMRDIVNGTRKIDRSKPTVYKSVGMSWQDLVVAGEIFERVPKAALR